MHFVEEMWLIIIEAEVLSRFYLRLVQLHNKFAIELSNSFIMINEICLLIT